MPIITLQQWTTGVDTPDGIGFCTNAEANARADLERRFSGKCWNGYIITEIVSIDALGDTVACRNTLTASMQTDVTFTARAIRVHVGDIVTGIRIFDGSADTMAWVCGVTQRPAPLIANVHDPPDGVVRPGMTVAIRVAQPKHTPLDAHVVASGPLLTCAVAAPRWRVSAESAASAAGSDALANLANLVRAETSRRREMCKDPEMRRRVLFVEAHLYAYRLLAPGAPLTLAAADSVEEAAAGSAGGWLGPRGITAASAAPAADLVDLVLAGGDCSGVWFRDPALFRSSPLVARLPADADDSAADADAAAVFEAFLREMLSTLEAVHSIAADLTPEFLATNVSWFVEMRKAQLDPAAAALAPPATAGLKVVKKPAAMAPKKAAAKKPAAKKAAKARAKAASDAPGA